MPAPVKPVPSVWARPAPEPRQPALSREVIVREAIAMLDEAGAEALSMRKLGARLNAGATSFYRHVATKHELMELAVDEVIGAVLVPPVDPPDWRAAVTACVRSFRETALRHPWLCAELGRTALAYRGPNLSALADALVELFTTARFPVPDTAIDVLYSYVVGMSSTESAWLTTVARSGRSEGEFIKDLAAAEGHEDPGIPDPVALRETKFTEGLAVVLDGLATRLPH
ncbi:TetR/AcrR family transcriptional regulator (plasmid) [Streptomyces sp. BI20]|uniref:TetR/AcrR family transcriptional regulator n=1 Tax=Streptomyces sp. BI20 TaxID=3403460 RepID=UPI003C79190E